MSDNNIVWHQHKVDKSSRAEHMQQKPAVIWFTGLSGSGKSTLANLLEQKDAGMIVLTAFISPFKDDRNFCRHLLGDNEFIEVFIDTPLDVCEQRDPKGLYQKARQGDIKHFTGIDSPYEAPENPDIHLQYQDESPEQAVDRLYNLLQEKGHIAK